MARAAKFRRPVESYPGCAPCQRCGYADAYPDGDDDDDDDSVWCPVCDLNNEGEGEDAFYVDGPTCGTFWPVGNLRYWQRRRVWNWSRNDARPYRRAERDQADSRGCEHPACPSCRSARRVRLGERVSWRRVVAATEPRPGIDCGGLVF